MHRPVVDRLGISVENALVRHLQPKGGNGFKSIVCNWRGMPRPLVDRQGVNVGYASVEGWKWL